MSHQIFLNRRKKYCYLSRDKDERHGVKYHAGLFQERYNGTYIQAGGVAHKYRPVVTS